MKTLLLGLLQGATEFLPVSSSGHLVLAQHALGFRDAPLLLDTILHLGTLTAVFVVFWRDLWGMVLAVPRFFRLGPRAAWRQDASLRLIVWIGLGTIPAGLAGVLLEDTFEKLFGSPHAVGIALLVTAAVLFSTRLVRGQGEPLERLGWARTLAVGVAQAVAITPGVSRSGMTIVAGLHAGMDREAAGRFSFLLAIPAILGAVVLQAAKAPAVPPGFAAAAAIGFFAAAISGYLALRLLLRFVRAGRLHWFGFYCILVALLAFTI